MRIRIDLAYDGSDFNGWATQPGLPTVQADVEAALATALRIPEARVVCAGRTDAGVHARGQVLHVDIDDDVIAGSAGRRGQHPLAALQRRLNGILPSSIRVRRVMEAPRTASTPASPRCGAAMPTGWWTVPPTSTRCCAAITWSGSDGSTCP